MSSWILGILCMSAVAQGNDYSSFNLLAVGPDTENYTKVFPSHFFSVCRFLFLFLSHTDTHSLSLSFFTLSISNSITPLWRRTFALRKHCTRHLGNDRAHSTNAIRPRKHQYVQVSYIPSWYKDYKGPKLYVVLYTLVGIQLTRIAQQIQQRRNNSYTYL